MKTLLLLILSLCLSSTALALDCAPSPQGASLTVSGFGEVQSAGLEYDGDVAVLYDACLKRGEWLVRFEQVRITNPDEGASLESARATLETTGATGTVFNLRGSSENLQFAVAQLTLDPSYQLEGFPRARYTASAASGGLDAGTLTLNAAVLNRLGNDGGILERYIVGLAQLRDGKAALKDVRLLQPNLAVNATTGSSNESGVTAQGVTGQIGRNSAGSEVTFSAANAVRLQGGALVFQGATVYFLGLPLYLGSVRYDPECPLELPILFSPFGGLTFGFDNIRFGCIGNARATIIGRNLLSATPKYIAFITASEGPLSLFVGQRQDETLKANILQNPEVGFTAAFSLDSGFNLEQTLNGERFIETRIGVAQAFNLAIVRIRPTLEVGAAGQSTPAGTTDATVVFSRAGVSAAGQVSAGPVTFSASAASSFALYSDGSSAANANVAFGLRLTLGGFSVGTGLRYQQQFLTAPIARHNLDGYTRLDADVRFQVALSAPPLGFAGLRLERTLIGVILEYDPRGALFVHQRFELGGTFSLYDGKILMDNFGQPYQTPIFALSPKGFYDLVTLEGELGAVVSLYGPGLIYDLGVFVTLPTAGLNFSFGVRLR